MSITYLEAIREAQARLLRDDKRVFIYGQDVGGTFGGAFKDFSSIALNQILNNAGTHYWRTNISVPITIRLPSGGTKGSGPFHSQSMESLYAHYPGLVVMTPATVEDAYTMLIDAVAIDDPVVYCEHKYLYYHLKAEDLPREGMPIGQARIARAGRDLTIVSYSAMLQESLIAAEEIAKEGFEIEVIDLRTVKPLDTGTVLASVARTGRLLAVGESFPWGGATAEVIARVTTEAFHLLDAAPARINAKDTPIPYHPNLWSAHRPNSKVIAARAHQLLRE
ncbi:MAG: alpha-ketoacid dehydrogenase subunit beta [Verrucomicrobia bacterium]|nr:MAG: alpha-ketoacid dehydrogenase subunit beta [Verrucomicrobiota bacterium]